MTTSPAVPDTHSDTAAALAPASTAIVALQRALAQAGWEVHFVDVDLTRDRPVAVIKCHRADGRWLWAKMDSLGRCTLETFHRESWLGKPRNAKGNWPQSPQVDDVFLGRIKPADAPALLEEICGYIANNAMHPVALADVRAAWAAALAAPARLSAP